MADTFKSVKITQPTPGGPLVQELVGAVQTSVGVADAGKVVLLSPTGTIDPTLIPPTGSVAFGGILTGTNSTATMTVDTGASIIVTGTGVVEATQLWAVIISTVPPTTGQVLTATSATGADWQDSGGGGGSQVFVNGSPVTSPNFQNGDVIWHVSGSNITATVHALATTGASVVIDTSAPTHAGQLLISQPGNASAIWADPQVQGLYDAGSTISPAPAFVAPTNIQPVLIGGSDGTVLRNILTDSSGRQIVNINGTVPVSGTVAVSSVGGTVTISGTVAATQSGTWNIGTVTTLTTITNPVTVTGTVAATQSGSWSVTVSAVSGTVAVTQSTSPWVVSGTVTANIGTTGGLALDATLTGGTQKTQVTDGTNALGTFANFGTSPGAVKALAANTSIFSGTTALTNTAGSLNVNITGGASSGTQYTNGTAVASGALVGTEAFGYDGTNVRAILTSSTGQQHVLTDSGSTTAVTGTVAVTQSTSPWVVSLTSTTITGTVAVTQSTSPWVVSLTSTTVTNTVAENLTEVAGVTLGATAVTAFGTAPAAANVSGTNASIYAGTTGLTATGSSLNVNITGGASSGAQFAMGSAQSSSALGTIALGYDGTNVRGLLTSTTGQLHTIVDSSGTLTVNLAQVNGVAVSSPTAWGTAPTGNVLGTNSEMFAGNTALTATGTSLNVNITGGGSSGTQYTEGTTVATPIGTAALGKNPSNVVETLRLDVSNNLLVDLNTPIPAGTNLIGQVEVTDGAGHTQPAGDSVTRPIITEITDGTNILGTLAHPLQVAQAGGGSSVNLSPNTTYAFTRTLVNVTTSGVSTLIPGVGAQTLRIYRFVLVIGSAVTITLQDTGANTLFPATAFIGNSTIVGEFDTQPKFPIVVNNGFAINLSTASTITGFIDYTQS